MSREANLPTLALADKPANLPVLLETSPATVEVLDVTRLAGRGRLLGLAAVEMVLDGVAIVLQGVRVLRRSDGMGVVEMPCYRHADGDLVPAVVLPLELEEAVARAVLHHLAPGALIVPA